MDDVRASRCAKLTVKIRWAHQVVPNLHWRKLDVSSDVEASVRYYGGPNDSGDNVGMTGRPN